MSSCICGLGKWSRPRSTKSNKIALGAIPKIVAETKNESASAKRGGRMEAGSARTFCRRNAAKNSTKIRTEAQPVHRTTNNQACLSPNSEQTKSPFVRGAERLSSVDRAPGCKCHKCKTSFNTQTFVPESERQLEKVRTEHIHKEGGNVTRGI
jgi:hypothetical protein